MIIAHGSHRTHMVNHQSQSNFETECYACGANSATFYGAFRLAQYCLGSNYDLLKFASSVGSRSDPA